MPLPLKDLLPAALRRSWAVDGTCPDLDLYSLFRARQVGDPHRAAVVDAKGKLCYTALDRKVRCLAVGLRGLGIGPGDVVGVQLPNGRDAVVTDLALAAVGAVALPFPVGRGAAEATSLLRRAEAVAVVAAAEHRGAHPARALTEARAALPALRHVVAAGRGPHPEGALAMRELLRADPTEFVAARPDPDGPARILVSSGSEAEPKMVAYSHNALAGGRGNFFASLMPDRTVPPRCLFLVPLASAFGSNGTAVALARHGGTLVLLDHFTPEAAIAAIREHEPTHVLGVPTMARMILDRLAADGGKLPPPTALVLGGSPLDVTTAAAAREAFGCPVVNLYGSADGVNCHTGLEGLGEGLAPEHGVVAGRPDPRVADIRVADPATHEPVPDGTIGEIVARGPMTPLCYVGAPDLDARYRTPDGWVRTGDLGLIDGDGVLHVVGRLKDVVIRGGANISPAEVERALSAHPLIRDVVCVGVPDPVMGERLAACVVPVSRGPQEGALTLDALGEHLTGRGLDRAKHPERLLLVPELPLTPAGKPDRTALRERAVAGC
ncbi:class I adenylate-forming enzyme family protein [Streptomyces spectabilis]|uniref:Acyl-CoA synthetase (AMP-forming)/AMP-acid ligase II n=1 Tax=Streptomyces spectabilis TaxID=68270 RepID=A0A5P2XCG2_STRST|nr:class I adenylate-forming enzyme family protein [Streptomyces spectabilis]MBB5104954.1 acyl-CoA synthetase (AMP-forming)/AMP-acid ligase II [Streptomyces spectabilis]MCI3905687.1 acyl--CoA ligase [Streptomyces spectabilis]QEV62643.1 long-chain fatty acid--CoA ligase [Streptomyces spectabilis]GGV07166.1 2,3-dihydroxybenzoate-AMP ligase [Streptomyces spectabilis]